ncbi:1,2-dihydroxy-3-keto-5-methylthiopentene dioxygenase [Leptolyngbya ohadii]|uniref:1,2-dihydroxy-3-keto-5-methylthiopentene dioxygenase n=1 Tax=Leptolyngbya ohadii TaxID=1962290 RepID=UPI000B5A0A0C|nr:cupin domain-containing protein [Leptolyngbya ohadii]
MATLQLEDGTLLTELDDIAEELAPLGIALHSWSIGNDPELRQLLSQEVLTEDEKEQVLAAFDHYFGTLQQTKNYRARDLVVLHPQVPNLDEALAKFDRIHTHPDDEVRYIIDGEGVFGIVKPDGSQVRLTIYPEEYINVPAGTEHWFYLTETRRIKAIRYFSETSGWVPQYTGREIQSLATLAAMAEPIA